MYSSYSSSSILRSSSNIAIWLIVSLVIAIVGGILIYFLFLNKKNERRFNGFAKWLYDFLSFKKMFMEALLKITYLILAIYLTLYSFALISSSVLSFFVTLIVGNIALRVAYEFALLLLVICKNTTEINSKLSSDNMNTNNITSNYNNGNANNVNYSNNYQNNNVNYDNNSNFNNNSNINLGNTDNSNFNNVNNIGTFDNNSNIGNFDNNIGNFNNSNFNNFNNGNNNNGNM